MLRLNKQFDPKINALIQLLKINKKGRGVECSFVQIGPIFNSVFTKVPILQNSSQLYAPFHSLFYFYTGDSGKQGLFNTSEMKFK